jgi:membrane associated rhomboid family serine protease
VKRMPTRGPRGLLLSLLAMVPTRGGARGVPVPRSTTILRPSDAEARWEAGLQRLLRGVERWPRSAALWLEPRAPRAARVVGRLQVDSPLVLSFAAACVVVQALTPLLPGVKAACFAVSKRPSLSPAGAISLLGHVLGHADWAHLQQNAVLLLLAGPACESALGAPRLCKIIGCTALTTAATHIALGPAGSVQLGASGVVFALILLNGCLERRADGLPLTFVASAALWLGRELGQSQPGVARTAHLSGAAIGTYFGHRLHVRRTWWGGRERRFED